MSNSNGKAGKDNGRTHACATSDAISAFEAMTGTCFYPEWKVEKTDFLKWKSACIILMCIGQAPFWTRHVLGASSKCVTVTLAARSLQSTSFIGVGCLQQSHTWNSAAVNGTAPSSSTYEKKAGIKRRHFRDRVAFSWSTLRVGLRNICGWCNRVPDFRSRRIVRFFRCCTSVYWRSATRRFKPSNVCYCGKVSLYWYNLLNRVKTNCLKVVWCRGSPEKTHRRTLISGRDWP